MKIQDHRLFRDDGTPVAFRASPNLGGELQASFLVMHYTAGPSAEASISWLCNPTAKASAHAVIGKDGRLTQLVPFNRIAWHAGASSWRDGALQLDGMNRYSIGLELDNPGRLTQVGNRWRSLTFGTEYDDADVIVATHKNETQPAGWYMYPASQLDAAQELAALLIETYRLKDVIGHEDIAPGRKSDPGPAFPMDAFRGRLFGRASDEPHQRYLTTETVNIRSGAGTQYATVVPEPLPGGTRVEVLGRDGVWFRVDVLDVISGVKDVQGWVHSRYLTRAAG